MFEPYIGQFGWSIAADVVVVEQLNGTLNSIGNVTRDTPSLTGFD